MALIDEGFGRHLTPDELRRTRVLKPYVFLDTKVIDRLETNMGKVLTNKEIEQLITRLLNKLASGEWVIKEVR